jgi:hypothetical protein
MPLASAWGFNNPSISRASTLTSRGRGFTSTSPASSFEKSRMPFTTERSALLAIEIRSPKILASGVRSGRAHSMTKAAHGDDRQSAVLAGGYMDRHATYVALSRHRQSVTLYYDRQTFVDEGALAKSLSRERAKDSTLDYPEMFAERRGVQPATGAGIFAAFRSGAPGPGAVRETRQDNLARVQAFARAWQDGARMQAAGHEPLAHQRLALERAAGALDRAHPGLAARVSEALERDPGLAASALRGRPEGLLSAADRIPPTRDVERDPERDRPADRDRGFER